MTSKVGVLPEAKATSSETANKVLVAEDDAMFRELVEQWLESWGYEVVLAEDGARAWEILQGDNPPELLIIDWLMPELDGLELCRRVRAQPRQPQPYILLVTARDDRQDVVRGLDAGADDYITKPCDHNEFRARLRVGWRNLELQTSLIKAGEKLQFQATHDLLTGVWNRSAVLDFLNRELERSARSGLSTAALMLDVDHFKRINDTYGHLTGDAVLKEVAQRITRVVRVYDWVGRYGGEEFLVVLPNCNREQIKPTADRIRSMVSSHPVLAAGAEMRVSVSIGASVYTAGAISPTQILSEADAALYRAKNNGRNCVVLA
jgi:diguanylate cyclase (GGDEF)-like protein